MELTLVGSENSPVLNPAFVIKNWGETMVKVRVGGKDIPRGQDCRVGHVYTLEGMDLIVWLNLEARQPTTILFSSETGLVGAKAMGKIIGPLLERIDIHLEVPAVPYRELRSQADGTPSASMREQVDTARRCQTARFSTGRSTNARMSHRQVKKFCAMDDAGEMLLKQAMQELGLSARAHDKILRVARTIADLDNSDNITCRRRACASSRESKNSTSMAITALPLLQELPQLGCFELGLPNIPLDLSQLRRKLVQARLEGLQVDLQHDDCCDARSAGLCVKF